MGLGCEGFTSIQAGLISELWNNANFETDVTTTVWHLVVVQVTSAPVVIVII